MDGVWRVRGPHKQAAVDLLLEHFPGATIPEAYKRVTPVVVTDAPWWDDPTREQPPPLPPPALDDALADSMSAPAPDANELAPIVALIPCPECGHRHEQPVRVVAESSRVVAKRLRRMHRRLCSINGKPELFAS